MKWRSTSALAVTGLVSMLGQVVLLRELAVASFGVELVILVGTACWLAAGASGALMPMRPNPWRAIGWGFFAVALLLPCEVAFLRASRSLFGGVPGAYLPLGQQWATAVFGLMPVSALLGWLFRGGARAMADSGGSLASSYGWESLGGALGCAAATASFAVGLSTLALAVICSMVAAVTGAVILRGHRFGAFVFVASLLVFFAAAPVLDLRMTGWNHPDLVFAEDTAYGRIAVASTQGQLTVFENDALVWDSEGTEAETLVHPAALQVAPGARVLVLQGGLYGVMTEVLKHSPSQVDVVELNGAMVRAIAPRLPSAERAALADRSVRLVITDPRAFLRARTEPYDLIVVGAGEPSSGQTNRFYTAEFFQRCAARLSPGGVLVFRLPSLENRWTPGMLLRNGAIYAALHTAFQEILVLPGITDVLLASQTPLERDPVKLGTRLRARGIAAREITPESLAYFLTNDRVATVARLLETAGAAANTDDRPVCYQQTALLWLSKFLGGARSARLPGRGAVYSLLGGLAVLLLASRLSIRIRPWVLLATTSFAAMALEAAVILRYQAWSGALFRDLGVLLTSFMLGLAVGAWLVATAGSATGDRLGRAWGILPLLALALFSVGFAVAVRTGLGFGLLLGSATLLVAGAAMAVLFGYASRMGLLQYDAARVGGGLYAADLLGGCLGSLLAGGLLILVIGLDGTALAMAGLIVVALVLVV